SPGQAGNNHPTAIPTGVFATADGHINIAASGGELFGRLCKAMEAEELVRDPRFATGRARLQNRDGLNVEIEKITRTRPSAEWIAILNQAGVPCGPINRINEVFDDPQVRHIGIARAVDHPQRGRQELVGQAVELSRTPWRMRNAAPEKGEHTEAVLGELGYDSAEITGLRARGII
ncbi:MAG: CoA transferase, partial [Candidatus Binataceae bacterium]